MARSLTFEDAVTKAVKAYYEGTGLENYEKKTGDKIKYNVDFFDDIQSGYKKGKKKPKAEPEETVEEDTMDDLTEDMF